jgi:hypothetical protein
VEVQINHLSYNRLMSMLLIIGPHIEQLVKGLQQTFRQRGEDAEYKDLKFVANTFVDEEELLQG